MKSFGQYLNEAKNGKSATFTFGRFNPPTVGHEKLIEKVYKSADGGDYFVYASQSNDAKKNPLDYQTKIKYMRKMFPRFARNIILDKSIKSVFDVLTQLYDKGYTRVQMVVGSDRVREFDALTNKYNNVKGRHGFYNFEGGVKVISAGERDPDADDVSGMSASKMRAAASANDFASFSKGLPSSFKLGTELFNDLRKAMGLSESRSFREHVQLESVSDVREAYVQGDLFEKGDSVVDVKTEEVYTVASLGANYVIVESSDGKKLRKWLEDIERLDEKLSPEDGVEAWIRDFIDSDAPQFKGKSKQKRIDMAIAAFNSAKDEGDE